MTLYRAVPRDTLQAGVNMHRNPGRRLPGNVPYLVDNVWEYVRPDDMPSRRHAIYASPTPELALQNAIAGGLAPDEYVACRLAFRYQPALIQLTVNDARHHPDIRRLQQLVNKELRHWAAHALQAKLSLAPLFLPGISKDELGSAAAGDALLDALLRKAAGAVTIWSPDPGKVNPDGELFFEIAEDNFYTLDPV
jgi:hypothetical protein